VRQRSVVGEIEKCKLRLIRLWVEISIAVSGNGADQSECPLMTDVVEKGLAIVGEQ